MIFFLFNRPSSNPSKQPLAKKPSKPSRSSLLDSSDDDDIPETSSISASGSSVKPKSISVSSSSSSKSNRDSISMQNSSSSSATRKSSSEGIIKSERATESQKPPNRKVGPLKSATAKVKTEVSSSESSSEDSEPCNKAAATAVLVQNKKKQSTSSSASTASIIPEKTASKTASAKEASGSGSAKHSEPKSPKSRRDTVDSSSDSSDSSSNSDSETNSSDHVKPVETSSAKQPREIQPQTSQISLASSKPKSRKSSSELDSNSTEKSVKNQHLSKDSGLNVSEHVSSEVSSKKKGSSESGEGKLGSVAASMASDGAAPATTAAATAAAVAAKQKSDREKLDLDKKMSKIFGTSSDDEEISFKNKVDLQQLHESDSDKASNASGPRLKSKKVNIFYMTFWLEFFVIYRLIIIEKVFFLSKLCHISVQISFIRW